MNIAFVIYRYFPHGGLQHDLIRIAGAVTSRGHQVTLLLAQMDAPVPDIQGMTVRQLPVRGFSNHGRMMSFEKQVHGALRTGGFDRVLMFNRMGGGDFYFAADNCLATEWGARHPAWMLRILPRYRRFLELEKRVFSPEARTVILAIVPRQLEDYGNVYHTQQERFVLLPPGISRECVRPADIQNVRQRIREELKIPQDSTVLVQVAAKFAVKGFDRSLKALAALPEARRRQCVLVGVGGDDGEGFVRLAEQLGIREQVVFAGARNDVPAVLAASDLMIHPARNEATGTVIVEALAVGIPVIASAACGYAHFAAELDDALVTPEPFCQDELNQTLVHALDALPELTRNAVQAAPEWDFYRRPDMIADLIEREPMNN